MKIEKINIENINSIEKAEISFSEGVLANEPLFLITGNTGSGKSTILDAITLALFDKSPRYENTKNKEKTENGNSSVQSTTNVLRKGTNDGKAEVWFVVGGERYVATWQVHKTRNGNYDTNSRRKLEVVKGENRILMSDKVNDVNDTIVQLVGLTYDQFIRSVMLAQGQFNTFLTSEKSKQTEILEMLTGTGIYTKIAEIVGKHKNEAKREVDSVNELYSRFNESTLSDEQVAELNAKLAENQAKKEKNDADIEKIKTKVDNFEKLDNLNQDIDNLKSQLADLQASYDKMLEDKASLKTKSESIKMQIDEQSGKKQMFEQMPLILNLLHDIDEAEDNIKKANDAIENSAADRIKKEAEISAVSKDLEDAANVQKNATNDYNECNDKFEKANYAGLIEEQNKLKTEHQNQVNRKNTCNHLIGVVKEYNDGKQLIVDEENKLSELKQNFKDSENDCLTKKSAFEAQDAEYQTQKNMVDEYMISLRAKLEEGKPCPLCGSTTHQYHDEKVVGTLFATIEKDWNQKRSEYEAAKDKRNKLETEINGLTKDIEKQRKHLENLDNEINTLCNGKPIYDSEYLEDALVKLNSKVAEIETAMDEVKKKIDNASELQNNLKLLLAKKNEADEKYKNIDNQYNKLKTEITEIDLTIKTKKEHIELAKKANEEKIQKANELIIIENWEESWRNSKTEFYEMLLQSADDWKKLNDDMAAVDSEIAKIVEIDNGIRRIEGFDRIGEFKGKVATRDDVDKNDLISLFAGLLNNLIVKRKDKKTIENQLNSENGATSRTELLAGLEALKSQKKEIDDTITDVSSQLKANQSNADMVRSYYDKLRATTKEYQLWTQLATAIGTTDKDNFRDVAQAYTMRILLNQANYFLRKLSQRYELTCYDNSLAIMVMDKEMGGELRSASSLSGGETFLVSLALALGLASLNDESFNIDMLFIDEGFGSLDGESLEMAVQALENMQKFGKKVGIISHVESLKDRIPAQIRLTKRGKAASEVVIK